MKTGVLKTFWFTVLTIVMTLLFGMLLEVPVWVSIVLGAISSLLLWFFTKPSLKVIGEALECIFD